MEEGREIMNKIRTGGEDSLFSHAQMCCVQVVWRRGLRPSCLTQTRWWMLLLDQVRSGRGSL